MNLGHAKRGFNLYKGMAQPWEAPITGIEGPEAVRSQLIFIEPTLLN